MSYKLFIDDLRDPVTSDWKVARSSVEAKDIVAKVWHLCVASTGVGRNPT